MRVENSFVIDSKNNFHQKALQWAAQFDEVSYLRSNDYQDQWSEFECLVAVKATFTYISTGNHTFQEVQDFIAHHPDTYIPGFFSYDLKNEIEELSTIHSNHLDFPLAYFFVPAIVIKIKGNKITITAEDPNQIHQSIVDFQLKSDNIGFNGKIKSRWTKAEYIAAFNKMQDHIQRGDIYEVNLCQEFFAENITLNPVAAYEKLNSISPTPFSAFFKFSDKFILSASPERFLAKRNNQLISQPIKGTAKRGKTNEEDEQIILEMLNSKKEIAENVMIVDLVRNDLTRSAVPKSVKANRLFEIQTFKLVHQMISTITSEKRDDVTDLEAIKNTFPAGSMTGAPKIAAMRICDQVEAAQRSVYAGSIGYFAPNGNFDFNVVIRTILYNSQNNYLSFQTGGAITSQANADDEYQECLLKANGMLKALDSQIN
ncbi:anthranilate synthase component I family protein [Sphingobacterium sp. SRCM116780]|uniref:anthranilate synthase component I family protein n=1 Tax=Sphingobacterium sp. SRCM116780 TaxID=2907623 RepID=UPI001F17CA44|nr:anthranilate synthase component I family protein [Sphingobacterium sp. SRCM116780]UIR57556.1 anthranilate synthase component I family protein [Sphingobacterium sp. SRCM116780]